MALTLYRKYRPQTFAELIGQNHIKTTLQSELASGQLSHAYLFSGPRGLGKTTTARLLAKAVNCLKRKSGDVEPCNSCAACDEVKNGQALDVVEIDAASHTGVDNVRENIIEHSRFAPTSRAYKVFIIDEVHMLSTSAFNALLKTLEEPPAHVIFVLATTELHKVPETIISRCQHFDFRRVPSADIISRLTLLADKEKKQIDREVLESVAYASQGCLRDAESLLGQILSLDGKNITAEQAALVLPRSQFGAALELIDLTNKRQLPAALGLINRLVDDGVSIENFTDDMIVLARQLLFAKVTAADATLGGLPKNIALQAHGVAGAVTPAFIQLLLEALLDARARMKSVDIVSLPLELAIAKMIGDDTTSRNDIDPPPSKPDSDSKIMPMKSESEPEKKIKTVTKEKPPSQSRRSMIITIDDIKQRWGEALTAVKQHNQSVASALKIGQPTAIAENGEVVIAFQHRFHRERINESRIKAMIERVLSELFGVELFIQTTINPGLAVVPLAEAGDGSDDLHSIAQSFGGELLD